MSPAVEQERIPESEGLRPVRHVYVSVDDKESLAPVVEALGAHGATIHSMGGTLKHIHRETGIEPVDFLEEQSLVPGDLAREMKGVQQALYAALQLDPENEAHQEYLTALNVPSFDLVIVGAHNPEKRIDHAAAPLAIMGAKWSARVATVVSPEQYPRLVQELAQNGGQTSQAFRDQLAVEALDWVSRYYLVVADAKEAALPEQPVAE